MNLGCCSKGDRKVLERSNTGIYILQPQAFLGHNQSFTQELDRIDITTEVRFSRAGLSGRRGRGTVGRGGFIVWRLGRWGDGAAVGWGRCRARGGDLGVLCPTFLSRPRLRVLYPTFPSRPRRRVQSL